MKRFFKWILIAGGVFLLLLVAAPFIVSLFWNVKTFKPQIEKFGSEAIGRPLTMGDEIDLSVFPWLGVALSDVHLENPAGFQEKDTVSVKSLEVRVKVLPLLSREIEVKRFVLQAPRIVFETAKDGHNNWEGLGQPSKNGARKAPEKEVTVEGSVTQEGLPIKRLAVAEIAIVNGSLLVLDHAKGERQEVSDVQLSLKDVSLDNPVHIALSARVQGKPIALDGEVGPVGKEPLKATVPLDIDFEAFGEIDANVKGTIANLGKLPAIDLTLNVSPFSPRKVFAALGRAFPVKTSDPEVLDTVSLKAKLKGSTRNVSISDGALELDESQIRFSAQAKEFEKPILVFSADLDRLDLDRYLPPSGAADEAKEQTGTSQKRDKTAKTDYAPLRRLVLDGTVKVGELKASGARVQDLNLKISGKNGRFQLEPLTLKLYEGEAFAKVALDVQGEVPSTNMELDAKGIQVEPLLKDVLDNDVLAGLAKAKVTIQMMGDDADQMKRSLQGKGDLLFKDGAIKGIDLPGLVRNTKASFGLADKGGERPRTDFSELHVPFTISGGVVNTPQAMLMSPLLRVTALGDADLVGEKLDFRLEPKFVATLKGQEDDAERSGVMVPVLVTGTFSSPNFAPDLKGMLKKGLEGQLPTPSELKKILPGQDADEDQPQALEEKAKGFIKGLPLGQ